MGRMKSAARELLDNGADGLVFGALTNDGLVDEKALSEMIAVASDKPLTFHRAFDELADPLVALDVLKNYGVARVLTSGGKQTAMEGVNKVAKFVAEAGEDLIIVPGGGVRSHNVIELIERTGAREVHSASRTNGAHVDPKEVQRLVEALA